MPTQRPTARLRALLKRGTFLYMPSVFDPLGARITEGLGFKAVYTGGYAGGASRAITEPLMTMTEQVEIAREIAASVSLPTVCDAGAGYGEPLHTMRTVVEFARAGIAGIHIEDQLFPKRAHYHKYVAHAIPLKEFVDKIRLACRGRDEVDEDFIVIARSDTARFMGLGEALKRVNAAAEVGADLGLVFPRNHKEAVAAPKRAKLPLIYVLSRGNRDGRPIYTLKELENMGYVACIDAQICVGPAFAAMRGALAEIKKTGAYTGLSQADFVEVRQAIEDALGLDRYYAIEEETVEKKKWGKR
ncbi:MAG: isocitrate lyase/PEP mutase family protein [Proteobacteria bacterium]|nr:isocitrate lyase/PEP mutase family protein [Pseudomonadota bacterium]